MVAAAGGARGRARAEEGAEEGAHCERQEGRAAGAPMLSVFSGDYRSRARSAM